jgi:hypothetical protein
MHERSPVELADGLRGLPTTMVILCTKEDTEQVDSAQVMVEIGQTISNPIEA